MLYSMLTLALVFLGLTAATPLKQTSRKEITRRLASRANSAKRAITTQLPILCGSSQTFAIQYKGISPSPQNKEYILLQPDRDYYSSYGTAEIVAQADTAQAGTAFRLDENCSLRVVDSVAQFAGYYMDSATDFTNYRLYFDHPSTLYSGYTTSTCTISTTLPRTLTCTVGVKNTFNTCPLSGKLKDSSTDDPLYIGTAEGLPDECFPLSLGVTLL